MIYRETGFLRSYDSAPRPLTFPPLRQHLLISPSSCVSPVQLFGERGGRGGGRGAESYDRKTQSSLGAGI